MQGRGHDPHFTVHPGQTCSQWCWRDRCIELQAHQALTAALGHTALADPAHRQRRSCCGWVVTGARTRRPHSWLGVEQGNSDLFPRGHFGRVLQSAALAPLLVHQPHRQLATVPSVLLPPPGSEPALHPVHTWKPLSRNPSPGTNGKEDTPWLGTWAWSSACRGQFSPL